MEDDGEESDDHSKPTCSKLLKSDNSNTQKYCRKSEATEELLQIKRQKLSSMKNLENSVCALVDSRKAYFDAQTALAKLKAAKIVHEQPNLPVMDLEWYSVLWWQFVWIVKWLKQFFVY